MIGLSSDLRTIDLLRSKSRDLYFAPVHFLAASKAIVGKPGDPLIDFVFHLRADIDSSRRGLREIRYLRAAGNARTLVNCICSEKELTRRARFFSYHHAKRSKNAAILDCKLAQNYQKR